MGPLGELGALFNPGMRHEEEEKRAKQMLREEEGTGRKGRLSIDLASGVVVIGSDRVAQDTAAATAAEQEPGEEPAAKPAPTRAGKTRRPGISRAAATGTPVGKARRAR